MGSNRIFFALFGVEPHFFALFGVEPFFLGWQDGKRNCNIVFCDFDTWTRMPRQPRYFLPDIPQHVIQRGVDRRATFFDADDYRLYLQTLADAARKNDCRIHSYVLMTNHTHLLLTPGSERALPLIMQAIG